MPTRLSLLFILLLAPAGAQETTHGALRTELRRLIDAIQANSKVPALEEFVAPVFRQTVLPAVRDLQKLLREQKELPMSELSPPILVPAKIIPSADGKKAHACVDVIRFGSVVHQHVTSVEFSFDKEKDRWRVGALNRVPDCGLPAEKEEGGRG